MTDIKEHKDEELEKVAGGYKPGIAPPNSVEEESCSEGLYCPDCHCYITLNTDFFDGGEVFCPTCNKDVKPIAKIIF